jgi:hypothetical protein
MDITSWTSVSENSTKLLFEGVASSNSLDWLDVRYMDFVNPHLAAKGFVDALRQNRCLKKLGVSLVSFQGDSLVSGMFEALAEANIITDLELYENLNTRRLPLETMAEVVCREDYSIEKL